MADETNKLLPCPWPECRSDNPEVLSGTDLDLPPDTAYFSVECMSCHATGPWGSSANQAIKKWNSIVRIPWLNGPVAEAIVRGYVSAKKEVMGDND